MTELTAPASSAMQGRRKTLSDFREEKIMAMLSMESDLRRLMKEPGPVDKQRMLKILDEMDAKFREAGIGIVELEQGMW